MTTLGSTKTTSQFIFNSQGGDRKKTKRAHGGEFFSDKFKNSGEEFMEKIKCLILI